MPPPTPGAGPDPAPRPPGPRPSPDWYGVFGRLHVSNHESITSTPVTKFVFGGLTHLIVDKPPGSLSYVAGCGVTMTSDYVPAQRQLLGPADWPDKCATCYHPDRRTDLA